LCHASDGFGPSEGPLNAFAVPDRQGIAVDFHPEVALLHKSMRDSSCEASVVAGVDQQTEYTDPQDTELARLQQSAQVPLLLTIWFDPCMPWAA
jgi:hypothetical protein